MPQAMKIVSRFPHPQGGQCVCVEFSDGRSLRGEFPAYVDELDVSTGESKLRLGFLDIDAQGVCIYSTRVPREVI